ncbi:DUF2726 domain-containing protein [Rhizobacter sp. Root404]|uniref:DUF2726 domain-containing protein n=1 Tax=Rhizobacter sp. Root404 TaxID=1736528 RepID=UPI0006F548D0|nr:DUF2726 domain-containing protein [Rhizobacter sp. Root404]
MQMLPWIIALTALALLAIVLVAWALRRNPKKSAELPTEWALAPRPVFSTDERRVYRLLREALPHHIVLSKLPLVRFCQPTDPNEVRYWFDLLGTSHVTFAVCSANGRVLAAIDLDTDRGNSRRVMQIKQSVLSACRVRYLRCPVDQLPSVAELQLLVPSSSAQSRGPQPAPAPPANLHQARDSLSHAVASRRAERTALWQDSTVFQDSFFAPDSRDGFSNSEFAPMPRPKPLRSSSRRSEPSNFAGLDDRPDPLTGLDTEELGGVVDDNPRYSSGSQR